MNWNEENIIKYKSDTKHRKEWFTGLSFSHPAKMVLPLQVWLIENFTKEGETILDPMAGSGTIMVACSMGRNVICVELEQKFIRMMIDNREKINQRGCQLGYTKGESSVLWGDARSILSAREHPYQDLWLKYPKLDYQTIKAIRRHNKLPLKGDARNLTGILVDKIITSPPYAEAHDKEPGGITKTNRKDLLLYSWVKEENTQNLGNLPYGSIDAVISSPPYEETMGEKHHSPRADKLAEIKGKTTYTDKVDAVISSPPYEGIKQDDRRANDPDQIEKRALEFERAGGNFHTPGRMATIARHYAGYAENKQNIGNLKSTSYLEAMLQVYQQCHSVLKDGGLMVLVTKNFIRNQKQVRLDLDTIKLCEQAGFVFKEHWFRELASQSFWRTIYYKKYPDVEPIKFEDVLVFIK